MTDDTRTPTALAETYFRAWPERDEAALRSVLADDVTFRGPLGTAEGVDACVAGLLGMAQLIERIDVLTRVADPSDGGSARGDVITFFDLHTSVADPAPTANWSHVEDGRITAIRVAFDPRALLVGLQQDTSGGG